MRRGLALIVVLGILVILVLLATTFAVIQGIDRTIARNYLDGVRARMLAQSGVEAAVARLQAQGIAHDPGMRYQDDEHPSYAIPVVVTVDGVPTGLSGTHCTGTYAANGDAYRLRVTDANSLIHVNDPSQSLRRILNNLGTIVGVPGAGTAIVDHRPPGGYASKRDLEKVLGSASYQKIAPFVTAHAWVDHDLANPVPISVETLPLYPVSTPQVRYGRSRDANGALLAAQSLRFAPEFATPTGTEHAVLALDELSTPWVELTMRAPVNVNLAPKEVLTALIIGLRGVMLVDRRKTNPAGNMYAFMDHGKYDNSPGGKKGDEIGFLYSTLPFVPAGATGGIPASWVADEIVACREKKPSPRLPGVHYGTVWYGGPFRSWRQFYRFCDGLVAPTLLQETRTIFYDYQAAPGGPSGSDALTVSVLQRKFASQALADVLKANFNPNLTLNETNPDANLYLIVDKTDLIANSTEFCFTSMGIFEIESEGFVVRTADGKDLLEVKQGTTVARKKISCVVKIFDAIRETTQADFAQGSIELRPTTSRVTNNNRRMEIGPEPDNGAGPSECRWSGWIQLSTIGGPWTGTQTHPPNTMEATPEGDSEWSSTMHAHFGLDHRLHHHAGNAREPIRNHLIQKNNPDRTETTPGPYGPPYRLARGSGAMSDLRIDGAYVERDGALMYENGALVYDRVGTVAFWVKPSFFPEMTGKPRTFFSADTTVSTLFGGVAYQAQLINGQWFFPSHDKAAYAASSAENAFPAYSAGPWRPMSFVAGYSTVGPQGGGFGTMTPSLNHRSHPDAWKPDLLAHHRWVHVAYRWDMANHTAIVFVNGQQLPGTVTIEIHPESVGAVDALLTAPLRFGEPSRTTETVSPITGATGISRNWAADATIDEIYLWKGDHLADAQDLYAYGRYYKPKPGQEAKFTSRALSILPSVPRVCPPGMDSSTTVAFPVPEARILGVGWTVHSEFVSPTGVPKMRDYGSNADLNLEIEARLVKNGAEDGPVLKDDLAAATLAIAGTDELRYRIIVRIPQLTNGSILHATPAIDDVTIYFTTGATFLEYVMEGVCF